jgi:hypothetical protein
VVEWPGIIPVFHVHTNQLSVYLLVAPPPAIRLPEAGYVMFAPESILISHAVSGRDGPLDGRLDYPTAVIIYQQAIPLAACVLVFLSLFFFCFSTALILRWSTEKSVLPMPTQAD